MIKARIYIANLGAYVRGELVGEWINLPASDNELQNVIDKVLAGGVLPKCGPDEEIAIHDYESNFGLEIDEYYNPFRLNELLSEIEEANEEQFNGILRACDNNLEYAVEVYNNGNYTIFYDVLDQDDLGRAVVEEGLFGISIPEELENYIDYEAIGRDYEINNSVGIYTDLGIAVEIYE